MSYPVKTIANYFIKKAHESGEELSPMKLIKLCYIAQGTSLAFCDVPVFREPVEAWKYGPVICDLYQEFKRYGNSSIIEFYAPAESAEIPFPDPEDQETLFILEAVWNQFGSWTGVELSAWTHQKGSAWYKTYDHEIYRNIIPRRLIKEEFAKYVNQEQEIPESGSTL